MFGQTIRCEQSVLKMFVCQEANCGRRFRRKFDLRKHIHHLHGNQIVEKCFLCGQLFAERLALQEHYRKYHKPSRHFAVKDSAFNRNVVTFRYTFLENENNFEKAQLGIKNIIRRQIELDTAQKVMTKVSLIFIVDMIMIDHQGEKISKASIPFRAPTFMVSSMRPHVIDSHIQNSFRHQRSSLDQFMNNGSQWQFDRALAFDVEIARLKPMRIGKAQPINISGLKNKRFLYNPPNKNNKCFLYCIAYFMLFGLLLLRAPTAREELFIKKETRKYNLAKMSFPTSIEDVKRFLKNNPHLDLRINILYRGTEETIYPLEFGLGNGTKILNLLLLHSNEGAHFVLIKNVDSFLRQTYNAPTRKDGGERKRKISYQNAFFCLHCLNHFYSKKARNEHMDLCCLNKPRKEEVPSDNEKIIKFRNVEHQSKLEYIGFLDFESCLPDIKKKCPVCTSLKCKCDCSKTDDIHEQIPITYSLVILGPNDTIIHEHTKSCENAHIDLMRHLLQQEEEWLADLIALKEPMNISHAQQKSFNESTNCYLCGIQFGPEVIKCRDHSHATAAYIGAACQSCNLRRRKPSSLKIYMHNASKYDMHFIIQAMAAFPNEIKNISVLPYNGENFRTLRFNSFQFLDTMSFLPTSLAQLSENLSKTDHPYNLLQQTYLIKFGLERILHKGFFPYEYCSSFYKMKKTKKLPDKKAFYSSLSESTISDKDHAFANEMWHLSKCKNLVDYAELYCKIDTILLAEIFLAFREKMYEFSGLDPAHYISLPAFGYDTMLKITKNEIELPTDISMVHFFEQAKRGGVSFINTRYLELENDSEEIVLLDWNNLYGFSQVEKLPYKDYRWLSQEEVDQFDVAQDLDGEKGYFVECDLHYPKRLHKKHANFPIAAEMLEVGYENLSPYSKEAVFLTEGKKKYKDVKLMSTCHDRQNYICHAKNLHLYLSLGLELIKIHRIIEFSQKEIFAPYLKKTTKARQLATNKFEMDLFKLMVKSYAKFFA